MSKQMYKCLSQPKRGISMFPYFFRVMLVIRDQFDGAEKKEREENTSQYVERCSTLIEQYNR